MSVAAGDDDASPPRGRAVAGLALAALGVVYGDIGTSPLYALKECFAGVNRVPLTHDNVLGVLSLVFWSLHLVISVKYIRFVTRADNRGEGGILSLLALIRLGGTGRRVVLAAGVFGAALLYGDGVITPAISVLGALEGLSVATPAFDRVVVPLAALIITGIFAMQRHGTGGLGRIFGPLTAVWFVAIALLGVRGILLEPAVLHALNPWHAVQFFGREGVAAFAVLGAVVLVITGGEALYADMGHFGRRPIQLAWIAVVTALSLNYFGQGAMLLHAPTAAANPFYALVPAWAIYPMVGLATLAACIASQALISGAFSLTRQAMQLGFAPRMRIRHTSSAAIGQIYLPGVNWALWAGCLVLVFSFRSAGALAAAYGVAVTGTMLVTSLLFAVLLRQRWQWPLWRVAALTALFLTVDLAFLSANLLKVPAGGWFPLASAVVIYLLMSTWQRGRQQVSAVQQESSLPLDLFLPDLSRHPPHRVPGVAVFMTAIPDVAPPVLLHHLKHNKVLHQQVVLMTITSVEIPQVPEAERVTIVPRQEGFHQVTARYGFMETPDVSALMAVVTPHLPRTTGTPGTPIPLHAITFYLGRETLIPRPRSARAPRAAQALPAWRVRLFAVMNRNAQNPTAFFALPPNRVVELGAQIQL